MTDRTCKNCRFWGAPRGTLPYGECHSPSWITDEVESDAPDPAGVQLIGGGDCWWAEMTTGPDFGCIHFEERKQEEEGDERRSNDNRANRG